MLGENLQQDGDERRARALRLRASAWVATVLTATLAVPAAGGAATAGLGAETGAVKRAIEGHELKTLDGRSLTLGSLRGEVVVVNFWATWCRSCQRELPALAALQDELGRHGGQVLAVSIDQDPRNVQRFVRAHALKLPIAVDGPDGLARQLDLRYVPLTLVLDRRGQVAFVARGADPQGLERAGARARELLAAAPTGSEASAGVTP